MNHDKLCRCANCHHPRETECDCAVIEATRADERKQAAQRVKSRRKYRWPALVPFSRNEAQPLVMLASEAIAAARGEDTK